MMNESTDQVRLENYLLSPSEKDRVWETLWHSSNNPKGALSSFKSGIKYGDLSFDVRIDQLTANQEQPVRREVHHDWAPATIRTGYIPGKDNVRWAAL